MSHPDRAESCVFFSVWPYRTSFFQCLVARTSFFERLTVPKKLFSSLTPSRTSFPRAFRRTEEVFFNYFQALSRPGAARGAHWKARGRQKYTQLGPNRTHREAKRASRQRSKRKNRKMKKTSAVEARAGFSRYPRGPEQAFSRVMPFLTSVFERLAVLDELFRTLSRP